MALLRPLIRFSSDEAAACHLATNEIQFFDGGDFSKGIINRLRVPGVAAVELSKNPGSYVAAFVPESKVCYQHLQTDSGVRICRSRFKRFKLVLDI